MQLDNLSSVIIFIFGAFLRHSLTHSLTHSCVRDVQTSLDLFCM